MAEDRRVRSRPEEDRDWAGIEAIDHILGRLNAVDYLAFAGTCMNWRSLAKLLARKLLASHPPLLLIFHPGLQKIAIACITDGSTSFYRCPKKYYDCAAYTQGFLVMLYSEGRTTNLCCSSEIPEEVHVLLYQPFTRKEISCFPPVANHDIFRVVMSAPPSSPDCVIVAVVTTRDLLLYCRPGDSEWKEFACPDEDFIMDLLVIAHGKAYCMSQMGGDIMVFNNVLQQPNDLVPTAERLPPLPIPGIPQGCTMLTSKEGDLYVVTRSILAGESIYEIVVEDTASRAYLYAESNNEWIVLDSFGGSSAFITWSGSILINVAGPEEWQDGLCCHPEMGWYHLNAPGREDIACLPSWVESLAREGFTEEISTWIPSAYWVLPSLCYDQ